MAIELCILASGSAGNCSILRTPNGTVMIDAGIGPRVMSQRLNGTGSSLADVSAVCLTHLDSDHFNSNWIETLIRLNINVLCHIDRVADIMSRAVRAMADSADSVRFERLIRPFDSDLFEPFEGLSFQPISLAHDWEGSHGFVIEGYGHRVGFATDLGRVPGRLIDHFCRLNVLAIESNYDPQMQLASPRPAFLKHRITGGHGHLSNQQAFDTVRHVFDRCERAGERLPEHVVLLHRSRECNCPKLLRSMFSRDVRIAPRLTLAEQNARTEWLRPRGDRPLVGEQLRLAWG